MPQITPYKKPGYPIYYLNLTAHRSSQEGVAKLRLLPPLLQPKSPPLLHISAGASPPSLVSRFERQKTDREQTEICRRVFVFDY